MNAFWDLTSELDQSGTPFVVVTLVSSRGHAPQDPGAKIVVASDGLRFGTVGGGKVEARAIQFAREWLGAENLAGNGAGDPRLVTWNLQKDIGMTCGGEVTYLFELHGQKAWKVAVFGAGHVAQALVRVLEPLDCSVTCIDAREEWVSKLPKTGRIRAICAPEPAREVQNFDSASFFVVMTQGHAADVPILEEILRKFPNNRYVGVIGSELKGNKIKKELSDRGIPAALLSKLRCPIGLPLGKNHPYEIAISVAGELLQVRDEPLEPQSII